jgi:drug/metabolite transporter (DMT)-like permease
MSTTLRSGWPVRVRDTPPVGVVLGLLVAVAYGSSDFVGGLATKQRRALQVVPVGQLVAAIAVAMAMVVSWGHHRPVGHDLLLGIGAGASVAVAVTLLFRGLASGAMSVIAPVTAVGAAVIPFVWGVLHGERPSGVQLVGAVLAVAAVSIVARPPASDGALHVPPVEIAGAVLSGVGFGLVFVLLSETSSASGLWPVLASKTTACVVISLAALAQRVTPSPGPALPLVVGGGVLDALANGAFIAASRSGLVSVMAVLSSLYPAPTLVLARVVLGERTSRLQQLGLGLTLAGVVLLAAG